MTTLVDFIRVNQLEPRWLAMQLPGGEYSVLGQSSCSEPSSLGRALTFIRSKYAPVYRGCRKYVPGQVSSPGLTKLQTKRCKRHDRPGSEATSRHDVQRTSYGAYSDHPTTACIEQLHFHVRTADICAYNRAIFDCCRQETRQALQSRQGGTSSCQLLPQRRICGHHPCASSATNSAVTS